MQPVPRPIPTLNATRRRTAAIALAGVALGGLVAGCDVQEDADLDRGRALFIEKCGTCHVLAEAGTAAVIGPSLDSSFAEARKVGMDQDTIEGVVQAQIENPRTVNEEDPDYAQIFMPADLVTGRDAEAVAAYVASVAGVPDIQPPPLGTASELFQERCGQCHQLAAAGTAGQVGPVLDEVLPGQDGTEIAQSIQEPDAKISAGFAAGIMPAFPVDTIPEPNLNALVQYLIACTDDPAGQACTDAAGQTEADSLTAAKK